LNRLKVLFHVNEAGRWPRVLLNAKNFINDVGRGQANIEILANGAGVAGYAPAAGTCGASAEGNDDGKILAEMKNLSDQGVVFAACRNALGMHAIAENSLPVFVMVVPAGITELAKKQAEGFAYIKQ